MSPQFSTGTDSGPMQVALSTTMEFSVLADGPFWMLLLKRCSLISPPPRPQPPLPNLPRLLLPLPSLPRLQLPLLNLPKPLLPLPNPLKLPLPRLNLHKLQLPLLNPRLLLLPSLLRLQPKSQQLLLPRLLRLLPTPIPPLAYVIYPLYMNVNLLFVAALFLHG